MLARDRWRQADAARMYDEARHAFLAAGDRAAAFLNACGAARAWLWVGSMPEALEAVGAAEALAVDSTERVMVAARRAAWCLRERRLRELVEIGDELTHLLEGIAGSLPHDELAYALRGLCIAMQHGGPSDRTLRLCEAAQARLRDAPADAAGLLAAAHGNALHWLGRPAEARQVLEGVQSRLDSSSDPAVRIAVFDGLMRVLHSCGDLTGALAAGANLLPLARLADAGAVYEADVMHVQAAILAAQGRPVEALACFAEIERRLAADGQPMREAFLVSWAHAEICAGQLQSASQRLAGISREPGQDGFTLYDWGLWWARARLAQALGEDTGPCLKVLDELPVLPAGPQLRRRAIRATLSPPPSETLRELVLELRHSGYAALEKMVCCVAARRAASAGRAEDAIGFLDRSLELQACVDAWADEPARVWSDGARILSELGHHARAAQLVDHACQWLDTRSALWESEAARRSWREGNPRHRHLLAAKRA
jgi:tetratricopeptide (TPR) repeat protein